uniref:NB-ARC domain-containing protein n=1 Tax=Leersia perrieri TaxID=77586 RepID=A0A0D9XVQ1_9ORYZ
MNLVGMLEWEEWEWDQQLNCVQAMPALEKLMLVDCKLRCLPPGLSSKATALTRISTLWRALLLLSSLSYLITRTWIASLPILQKLDVVRCPNMKALEGLPKLQRLELEDEDMEDLPGYLSKDVSPRYLILSCSIELLTSIAAKESGPEWRKLSHVEHANAYANNKQ